MPTPASSNATVANPAQKHQVKARLAGGFSNYVIHGLYLGKRNVLVQGVNCASDARRQGCGIAVRSYHQGQVGKRLAMELEIGRFCRKGRNTSSCRRAYPAATCRVSDHSHHGEPRRIFRRIVKSDSLADRIFTGPVAASEIVVDHHHARRA